MAHLFATQDALEYKNQVGIRKLLELHKQSHMLMHVLTLPQVRETTLLYMDQIDKERLDSRLLRVAWLDSVRRVGLNSLVR